MKHEVGQYILDKNGKPKPEKDILKWAKWFQSPGNRIVEHTHIGDVMISTVFMGLDHSFGSGKPVLWETMIFGSKHKALKDYQVRYTAISNARKGHKYAVQFAKNILKK